MMYKKLQIGSDLREQISYETHNLPLSICIDHFDDYFNREWECHWHEEFEFSLVLQGQVTYAIHQENKVIQKITLQPGDGIFINSKTLHSARALYPNTVLACFVFPLSFFEMKPFSTLYRNLIVSIVDSKMDHLFLGHDDSDKVEILQSMKELCSLSSVQSTYELQSLELICRIWRLLFTMYEKNYESFEKDSIQGKYLKQMLQFIHENYYHSFSIDKMANFVGVSRTECFRSFKKQLNTTPTKYILEYRLSMASMLLTTTTRSLIDISQVCGFSTPSYFGLQFKKYYHVTPGQYRQKNRS